nr:11493_t:CDS:2 [Entrophospora candida]
MQQSSRSTNRNNIMLDDIDMELVRRKYFGTAKNNKSSSGNNDDNMTGHSEMMASCTRLYDQLDKISDLLCDFTELSKTYLKKDSKKLIDLQNKWSKNILKMKNLVKHLKILVLDSDDEKPQGVNKCDDDFVDGIMIGTESNPLVITDSYDLSDILNTDDDNNNNNGNGNNNNFTYLFSDDDDVKEFLKNIKNTIEMYDNEFDYRIINGFPLNLKQKGKEPQPIVPEINNINSNDCKNKKDCSDNGGMELEVEIDTSKLEPIDKLGNLQCIDFHQGSGDVNEMAIHISKFKNHEVPKLAIAYIANHDPKYNMAGNLQLFDARKGTVYYLQGHYDYHTETTNEKLWKSVTDVKFSQGGKFIYSCSTDKKVIIWSSIGKEDQICTPLATVECEGTVNRIVVKHDKSKATYQFASCDNSGSITCFSLNADEGNSYKLDKNILQVKTKTTTAPPIVDIIYGIDYFDQTIIAGFEGIESQKDGFIRLWDIETKRKLVDYKIGSNNSVSCLGMSTSGYRVACGVTSTSDQVRSDGNIRLIELESNEKKIYQTNEYDSNVIAFSPDDQYIALGGVGNKVWVFDTRYENKPLRMLPHTTPNDGLIYEGINGIQWINSNMILTGGSDGIVKLWDINKSDNSSTCLKYEFPEHDSPITCIRANEDLNYLSVGVSTGRVYLYSTDQAVLNNRDNIKFYCQSLDDISVLGEDEEEDENTIYNEDNIKLEGSEELILKDDLNLDQSLKDNGGNDKATLAPLFVRLAWHASGTFDKITKTGGSNGATMRCPKEANDGANNGLKLARDELEKIKEKFPEVSYADIWTLAGVVAIKEMKGPEVQWTPGRKDIDIQTQESLVPDPGRLPDADKGADHIEAVFSRMGFNNRETVALIGAHSLGHCHPETSGYEGRWTHSPTTFTNMFFRHLLKPGWQEATVESSGALQYEAGGLMMLPSDMALLDDRFRGHVEEFANNQEAFFRAFAAAFGRLLELGFIDSGRKAKL